MKLLILILLFCVTSAPSFATNQHLKILKAKERFVKTTQLGRLHAGLYEEDHGTDLILFSSGKTEYKTIKRRGRTVLRLNWALRSSSYEYLSWVLFQGLVRYDLEKKLGRVKLPELIEMDYYVFKKSMQYLDQSGMLITDEMDYANHPNFDFARGRILSIKFFYDTWQRGEDELLSAVRERREKLDKRAVSVLDYLARRNLKPKQRLAAKKLRELWYNH